MPGDILEVYDQAVIQEVFPHLSLREVELKLQRGEICSEPYRGGVVTSGDDGGDQTDIYHKSSTYLTYFNPSSANQVCSVCVLGQLPRETFIQDQKKAQV